MVAINNDASRSEISIGKSQALELPENKNQAEKASSRCYDEVAHAISEGGKKGFSGSSATMDKQSLGTSAGGDRNLPSLSVVGDDSSSALKSRALANDTPHQAYETEELSTRAALGIQQPPEERYGSSGSSQAYEKEGLYSKPLDKSKLGVGSGEELKPSELQSRDK